VRIKLDENIPTSAAERLRSAGHDVDTVADENLSGAEDTVVLRAATSVERLVVTLDRGFGDIRAYPAATEASSSFARPTSRRRLSRATSLGCSTTSTCRSSLAASPCSGMASCAFDGRARSRRRVARPLDGLLASALVGRSRRDREALATHGFEDDRSQGHLVPSSGHPRGGSCPSSCPSRHRDRVWRTRFAARPRRSAQPLRVSLRATRHAQSDSLNGSARAQREPGDHGGRRCPGQVDQQGDGVGALLVGRAQGRHHPSLGDSAGVGAVAAPHLAVHDRRPDRLLGPPVRGVDTVGGEEGEQR